MTSPRPIEAVLRSPRFLGAVRVPGAWRITFATGGSYPHGVQEVETVEAADLDGAALLAAGRIFALELAEIAAEVDFTG